MFGLIAAVVVLGLIAAVAGGSKAGARQLIPGHRYKLTMRTDVRRAGATVAQLESLTSRLQQLGFNSAFLEPIDTEPDPFTWDCDAVWAGTQKSLVDAQGIFFINAIDVSAQPSNGRFDADLPPDIEAAVERALQFESDPAKLHQAAASLRPQFPIAADNLDSRANALAFVPPGQTPPAVVLPPIPAIPPLISPPAPPPFLPPVPEPPPSPPAIEPPAPPPPSPAVASDTVFDPGSPPPFSPLSAAAKSKTSAHQQIQLLLTHFYAAEPVLDHTGMLADSTGQIAYGSDDVDGQWGPRSQQALWSFQRWFNAKRQHILQEDGLPGPASQNALGEWA
jgi:hypothetical protein